MNIETENDSIYLFNQKNNYGELNTEISTKNNYFSDPISKIPYFNTNNYDETHNTYHLSTLSKKKSYINNSIRKKNILLMFKPIIKPFKEIEYLNIKKIRIKKDIIPILTNNNIGKEILKNKSSIFNNKTKINLFKSKSLNNYHIRNLYLNKNISYNLNFFKDYEKEFFPNVDYSNLEYNEYDIYHNKALYENIIREKINYLKKNKNENKTIKFEKIIYFGKQKTQINLSINSLIITFEDMDITNESKNDILRIDLPFALLPIFYYKGIEAFQKLLAFVIKIRDHFHKIFFDDDLIITALNNISDYQENDNEEIGNDENYDFNFLYNMISLKKEKIAKKIENKPIQLRPLILQKNKDFLRFNYFTFFWVTNSKIYATKVTLPCITLNIVEYKITINHFLDYELLFFLYRKNFLNWEYYIIQYLSNYSKFRYIFQKLCSKMDITDKTLFLKEPKSKINSFSEEVLFNIYTDKFHKNHIILFKSFYVIINFIDCNYIYEKTYNIYFSFLQYIKLYEISKYTDKIDFLIKFLEINNDTHTLNFNYKDFDSFDIQSWMNNIKKFSEKSLKNNIKCDEKLYDQLDIYTKRLKIEFKKPQWSIIKFDNNQEIIKTWEIGKELEIDLVNSILYENTENWIKLLNQCLKKLNEPVPSLPSLLSFGKKKNKRYRHRNTSFSNSSSKSSKKERRSKF